jgi:acetyl-CoA carboxylase biotin carboxyl carrier protein
MNQKELKELIEFLIEKDVAEFELERGDVKVRIKRAQPGSSASAVAPIIAAAGTHSQPVGAVLGAPAVSQVSTSPGSLAGVIDENEEGLYLVKSPIVGTFYEAPSPGAPPFVKVGDSVIQGQALCIIEAMKLMNEIESDYTGEVAKVLVKNGQPVEYGQPLFAIRAR